MGVKKPDHKFEDCDCHEYYTNFDGELRFTCNLTCMKCSGASQVTITENKSKKTIKVQF